MAIKSEIIADSINPYGKRLTTYILEYPRYIHSELMTHRVFSRNAASSRAIPVEWFIKEVTENPVIPTHWGKNQSGMQANEELSPEDIEACKKEWLLARDNAIQSVLKLKDLNLHKQIANRILEPWFHIRIILSSTEFSNFFALRAHEDAHPDLKKLAYLMLDQYNESTPKVLVRGEWHIPFGDRIDQDRLDKLSTSEDKQELVKKIAVARCARISYYNFDGKDDYASDIKLADRLMANVPKHLSPAEHVAISDYGWHGNFNGWKQYRKFFSDENLSDSRIKTCTVRG